jgi:hypothetical protein
MGAGECQRPVAEFALSNVIEQEEKFKYGLTRDFKTPTFIASGLTGVHSDIPSTTNVKREIILFCSFLAIDNLNAIPEDWVLSADVTGILQ